MLGTLAVVETALGALGIAHGKGGVQAAVDYLAGEVPASDKAPTIDEELREAMGA